MLAFHAPDPEDDLAYIERLLDTLQGDRESQAASQAAGGAEDSVDAHLNLISSPVNLDQAETHAICTDSIDEAQDVDRDWQRCERNEKGPELNRLLNQFCKDGDESILDTLLDSFLTSKSDAASLVDALGSGLAMHEQVSPPRIGSKGNPSKVRLALDQLQSVADPENEQDLLISAQDLLQSARSSASSIKDPAESPRIPPSNSQPHVQLTTHRQLCEVNTAVPEPLVSPRARAEFLAKVAEMEDVDHEVARDFVRRFFIGVRRRVVEGTSIETDSINAEDDDDSLERSVETNAISEPSAWSCQSVVTESLT